MAANMVWFKRAYFGYYSLIHWSFEDFWTLSGNSDTSGIVYIPSPYLGMNSFVTNYCFNKFNKGETLEKTLDKMGEKEDG